MLSIRREAASEIETLRRENDLLRRKVASRDDQIAVLKETIDVLRDCLASVQAEKQLKTLLDKADLAAAIESTRAK